MHCCSPELHRRTDLRLANLPVSEAEKSRLKEALMSSVQRVVQEQDDRVRSDVREKVANVVAMVDPAARVAAVDDYVALAKTDLKQASHTWDSIQGTTSCGRIAFAKARDDVISAFNEGVESLKSIFTSLDMYNNALSKLNDEAHHMLFMAHNDVSTLFTDGVRSLEQRRKFIEEYIGIEKKLVPTQNPKLTSVLMCLCVSLVILWILCKGTSCR